jgi:hypothetical protein
MNNSLNYSDEIDTTPPALPKFGWLRVRRKNLVANARKNNDAVWTPVTSGPFIVPVTRWIE